MALSPSQREAIAAIDGPAAQSQQPAAAAAAQATQQQAPAPQANRQNPPQQTAEGAAQEKGAAKTEGDNMAAPPFIELTMPNGQKRQMTPEAITGMASRYAALNHRNAQLKPINDVIENYLKSNPNMTPAQLAETLTQLAAGGQANVQFGANGGINSDQQRGGQQASQQAQSPQRQLPSDDDFSKWENDNASALPPGYKDMHGNMAAIMDMMTRQQQMMQQLVAGSAGQVDAARQAHQGAMQQQGNAIQQAIGTNLDRAQQQLQLPTEAANDFMMFAHERGYSMEDFADPNLTLMVMQDFANNRMSPEMDRLRGIHQRRQAFTSTAGAAPGGASAPADPQSQEFADFAGRMVASKQL